MATLRSPHHPILARPWEFVITEMHYRTGMDGSASYLDLTFVRGEDTRRLRFIEPRDVRIEAGFPNPTHGLCILDVRDRQLERLRVEVSDFETSHGSIRFFAYDVVERDAASPA